MSSIFVDGSRDLQFEGVIFDMDGLLIDSERCSFEAWKKVGHENGYVITKDVFCATVGKSLQDTYAVYKQAFGDDFPGERLRTLKNESFTKEIAKNGLPAKNGACECLKFLNENSLPWAIGTTTKRESALSRLRYAGLDHYLGIVVCGDEVVHSKPEPDIYLEAAKRMGISPSRSLVVEDSDTGAQAGWNAGMQVAIIPDMKEPSPETAAKALFVLRDLLALKELLMNTRLLRRR